MSTVISDVILEVKNLSLAMNINESSTNIINDISFSVADKKITCLVGESGSGKSITIASILNLLPPEAKLSTNSEINFYGKDIFSVFQDPMNSFNFSVLIGKQVYQMARGYQEISKTDFDEGISSVLKRLRFDNPKQVLKKYPFELSGGMLQRILIGCGIFIKPSLIIADEPTTALDVTIQKEILREFRAINHEMNTAILVVTHDFGVVAELADDVIVMNHGNIVEMGKVMDIFDHPQEEYTKKLIGASFKDGEMLC